ncbi:MAG: hypothetical protein ACI9YR_002512, partial [Bacteroidia bacterium]
TQNYLLRFSACLVLPPLDTLVFKPANKLGATGLC